MSDEERRIWFVIEPGQGEDAHGVYFASQQDGGGLSSRVVLRMAGIRALEMTLRRYRQKQERKARKAQQDREAIP